MSNTNPRIERCPGSGQWAKSMTALGYSCPHCTSTTLEAYGRDQVLAEHDRRKSLTSYSTDSRVADAEGTDRTVEG